MKTENKQQYIRSYIFNTSLLFFKIEVNFSNSLIILVLFML